ncbi:MAG: hypothetical protein RLZZ522_1635, partial [Verrucomicrobiota bacterium]
ETGAEDEGGEEAVEQGGRVDVIGYWGRGGWWRGYESHAGGGPSNGMG